MTALIDRQLQYDNIYDAYGLYKVVYQRSRRYQKSEVGAAAYAMKQLADWSMRSGLNDFNKSGFNILEILAGAGEHQEFMVPQILDPYKLTSYWNLDLREHKPVGPEDKRVFVQGNAIDYAATTNMAINFAIGYFFTASTITDEHGEHSRAILTKLFENMRMNLPAGGGFMIDYTPNGYYVSMNSLNQADIHFQATVPPDSQLRTQFGISATAKCLLSYFRRSEYNRLNATCYDSFPKGFQVWADGELMGEIDIKNPLTQRYMSETEVLDCAKEAGFDEFMFFRCEHPRGKYEKLLTNFVVDRDTDMGNAQMLMSTNLLCINK